MLEAEGSCHEARRRDGLVLPAHGRSPRNAHHLFCGPECAATCAHIRHVVEFERLLADLSAQFVNLPAAQVDDAITDALRRIAAILRVDRGQVIRFAPRGAEAHVTHSGAVGSVPTVPPMSIAEAYPWAIRCVQAGQTLAFARLDDLPPEAAVDKASWQRARLKSILAMPLHVGGQVEGAITFDCMQHERTWPEGLLARIRVLATVLGNALAHKRAQEALDAVMAFEQAVSEVVAKLLTAGCADQDLVIETGLRDMARVFGAERATLWRRNTEKLEFTKTHRWLGEGVPAPPDLQRALTLPWISAQIGAGSTVRFGRRGDLPPEAAADLPELQALGIRAAVIVPLTVSGAVVGALSFATVRVDREWPDALLPRVKLVGEIVASLLARQEAQRREQEAQGQAAHAARVGAMGAFAASLVHELTQPLAASLANAETALELLADPSPALDELRATVADIVADDRRAAELIQQLRRFLRRGEVERTELDLRAVVDDVVRLVATEASDRGIVIARDVPEALPRVTGNRVQLQQVLLNLLLNGFDAVANCAPGSRRIALLVRPCASGVSVEVTDSGHGMDKRTLARVFEPFFTTKPKGMGLGLSISRTIVAAHGGTLSVRSTPGGGTTFRMELPPGLASETRAPQRAAVAGTGYGMVFVIEDDPSMRRALERQLDTAGYRVESFGSAHEYLERAPCAGVACIVSDVRMPGLSGLDLQATLVRAGRDLPMVFISGHGDVSTTVHAMKAGAVNFLAKPFTKGELLAAVSEALAHSRERDSAREARAALQARYESLTPREREVFPLVAAGMLNKSIADRLGAAEATIKIHRGRVMEKMGAESVVDLVRMAERLGLEPATARLHH